MSLAERLSALAARGLWAGAAAGCAMAAVLCLKAKAPQAQLSATRAWLSATQRRDEASFRAWRAATGFPAPGWAAKAGIAGSAEGKKIGPRLARRLMAALSHPEAGWSEPSRQADLEALARIQADRAASTGMALDAALWVLETIPQDAEWARSAFRQRMSQIDPLWTQRDDYGGEAIFGVGMGRQAERARAIERVRAEEAAREESQALALASGAEPKRAGKATPSRGRRL